jgi:hypothetical protein
MMNRTSLFALKQITTLLVLLLAAVLPSRSNSLEQLRQALEQSALTQVQEKVYVHTDNTCYFVGDTLWYKAYVVRADNLQPTDMSRILYVELLSPDGLLVERQNIIVAKEGYTCGQFVLRDSLYSGYYELRAYTRWNLNFNQRPHRYDKRDEWAFYNRQMAEDYFRLWDGLYSRAIPIYSKPETEGDYDLRRMYQRPKTRLAKPKKEALTVTFFPEGGTLVKGLPSRVAFEAVDQHGEAQQLQGSVWDGDRQVADFQSVYMGRGSFTVTPGSRRLEARCSWRGKDYTFDLPKAEDSGAVLTLDDGRVTVRTANLPQDRQYAVSVLCRGALKHFAEVSLTGGETVMTLPMEKLPAGVNDLTLFDSEGRILADRLFFRPVDSVAARVGQIATTTPIAATTTYDPYAPITISLQTPEPNTTFSVAVRDSRTDEPSYDDGNLLTSMLLSSELRGFIARPAYYFQSNDDEHRHHLDLLMMVQGWRKYKWKELADTSFVPRYKPETTMTVTGSVYKMLGVYDVELEEIPQWINGVGMVGKSIGDDEGSSSFEDSSGEESDVVATSTASAASVEAGSVEYGDLNRANDFLGINHTNVKDDVLVEAELVMDNGIVAAVQKTQNGRFMFEVPPFYGVTFLNLKAYNEKDSVRKAMTSRHDKDTFREDAYADFFVKRDMPYPVFTHDYNFYENHAPDWDPSMEADTLSLLSMENDVYQLRNVDVKGHRRGRRATDWSKPAFVRDAYDVYNDLTDYGLSFGKFDMRSFPLQVARFIYGNMGRHVQVNVDGRLNGRTYWRNYKDLSTTMTDPEMVAAYHALETSRAPGALYKDLQLSRLQNIRIYSDYEPRKEDSTMVMSTHEADVTIEMEPIADDGRQVVYRDRHIYFHGMNEPAEFYLPDYSQRAVDDKPADYRRTLYWNPNARSDGDGRFVTVFYNNGRDTRIRISAAGVTPDGRLLYY